MTIILGQAEPDLGMPRRIFKYPLAPDLEQVLIVPEESIVLELGADPGGTFVAIWAEVNPASPLVRRTIKAIMTGDVIPDARTASFHIGTFVRHRAALLPRSHR
jgi:hypothetical protein